jgi:serine/threonine-protein kinase
MRGPIVYGARVSKGLPQETICPVRPGDVVAGKYRVERTLGAGGMGVVVAATQLELDRSVALKFLLPRVLERRDLVARFAREARVAAKLQSEHVARVLDVGALDEDTPFIVMEYLDGEDLARLLTARGPLSCKQAVGYVLEAAEAVAEAHALGIVHRDLKPANLFLAKRTSGPPLIKVLDFGLSKFSELASQENVTSVNGIFGTPAYMSPEQLWSSRTADARSDIWSLGVVLYELLTAQCPFPHERMPELIAAILHAPAQPIDEWRDDVPPELAAIVLQCMEKDPGQRFANVALLAEALVPFGPPSSERSAERIALMLGSARADEAPTELAPPVPPPWKDSDAARRKPPSKPSRPGSGSPIEAAPTLKVASGDTSVAPVGRPSGASLPSRRKTAVTWTLTVLAFASLAALAGSVVVTAPTHNVTIVPPSALVAPVPAPAPPPSAPSTLTEAVPAAPKPSIDVPSSAPPPPAAPRAARDMLPKAPKNPAATVSAAPSASAPAKPAAPDPSALDPLSRLKPL